MQFSVFALSKQAYAYLMWLFICIACAPSRCLRYQDKVTRLMQTHWLNKALCTCSYSNTFQFIRSTAVSDQVDCCGLFELYAWPDFLLLVFAAVAVDLEGVIGRSVRLPCNVTSLGPDRVYMVLWFREDSGIPIYR